MNDLKGNMISRTLVSWIQTFSLIEFTRIVALILKLFSGVSWAYAIIVLRLYSIVLYQRKFSGQSWEALIGAKKQSLLWASSSIKNPAYPNTLYVAPLIGPNTDNIDSNASEAEGIYDALPKLGVDWSRVGSQLEHEGVDSFKKSFDSLLNSLQEKANSLKLFSH
ncbi:hypothetical protein VNO78_12596 [Psophocarpus tetragonolobus]|uniref:Uncharacterized protein n=1 Tax=Psophocarpus tetragonolobus TaxID=3891 RepID=A0AAN9SR86_PSOTE